MVGRDEGIRSDGPTDPFGGPRQVALLVGHDAQQVQGIGVVRSGGQEVTIRFGRLLQETALVLLDGQRQFVGHGKTPWERSRVRCRGGLPPTLESPLFAKRPGTTWSQ